jgi:carboxypeptidase family protein
MRLSRLSYLALAISVLLGWMPAAQSGSGQMQGYVEFEDVSYNEVTEGAIHATVELRGNLEANKGSVYTTKTDNRGSYDLPRIGAGDFTLTISAPGYVTYRTDILIPSDFQCRLATMLKKKAGGRKG